MEKRPGDICRRRGSGDSAMSIIGNIVLHDPVQVFFNVEIQGPCCNSLSTHRPSSISETIQVWNLDYGDEEESLLDDFCSG